MLDLQKMPSPRAASWVYDVINVFIDALEMEATSLRRGNTSWRFYNQQLEHIRPLNAYLTRDAQHILRDLLYARPVVAEKLIPHDELRAKLEAAATSAAQDILANTDLRSRVEAARKIYLGKYPKDVPTGAFPAEKHAELVVEHLINEVKELSAQYTDAAFWREHVSDFSSMMVTPACQQLSMSRQALLSYDLDVLSWLTECSFSLCQEFDIPAAPSVVSSFR
jgi:hypothetical protein